MRGWTQPYQERVIFHKEVARIYVVGGVRGFRLNSWNFLILNVSQSAEKWEIEPFLKQVRFDLSFPCNSPVFSKRSLLKEEF